MADAAKGVRQLVLLHGRDDARRMVAPKARPLIDIASEVLGDESDRKGFSYSGLALTSLPHRSLPADQLWERTVGPVTLSIQPGYLKVDDGPSQLMGVPYGARARLILIYLQTQAIITNNREVSLGRSMRAWMGRMGISVGGETAKSLREQARRIASCSMRFSWKEEGGGAILRRMSNERIIKSGLFFQCPATGSGTQENLFDDRVVLDTDFFEQMRRHPVPLRDAAIQQLKDSSSALDIYVWLAFRLHHLEEIKPLSWRTLYEQFGAGYQHIRQWKPRFLVCLAEAVAAYPEARVEVEETHILLHPSPPPVRKLTAS